MNKLAYFVSDLHLFCRRSVAERQLEALHRAADEAHTFVWGGDIFDFKWSTVGSLAETAVAARDWLADFIDQHRSCKFHYLLGNHDCNPQFVGLLSELANDVPHLAWHPYFVEFSGRTICLHGDVADRFTTQAQLEARRSRWGEEKPRRVLGNALYDAAVLARLHRAIPLVVHRQQAVGERILRYLQEHNRGPATGLQHVYFGHTHRRTEFTHAGVRFHNGGAPIKGLPFNILTAEISNGPCDGESA